MLELYAVVDGHGTMNVFEIYIKATPERLWEAIVDPTARARYSFGVQTESEWTTGSEYFSRSPRRGRHRQRREPRGHPPRRLVQSFRALWSDEVTNAGESTVTWEIEPVGSSCRLRVSHRPGGRCELRAVRRLADDPVRTENADRDRRDPRHTRIVRYSGASA